MLATKEKELVCHSRKNHQEYLLGEKIFSDNGADIYQIKDRDNLILKIAQTVADNELISSEKEKLLTLVADPDLRKLAQPYFPQIIDMVFLSNRDNNDYQVEHILYGHYQRQYQAEEEQPLRGFVLARPDNLFSLAEVKAKIPQGLDAKDMAWIYRRLLMALGFAHQAGLAHRAVYPENIFIEPEQHGLVLQNWKDAADIDQEAPPVQLDEEQLAFWPPEIEAAKSKPSPAMDIYMATCSMKAITDIHSIPDKMYTFFRGCLALNPKHRPIDAWDLKDEFDQLIEDLWGKRRFRKFPDLQTTNRKEQENGWR